MFSRLDKQSEPSIDLVALSIYYSFYLFPFTWVLFKELRWSTISFSAFHCLFNPFQLNFSPPPTVTLDLAREITVSMQSIVFSTWTATYLWTHFFILAYVHFSFSFAQLHSPTLNVECYSFVVSFLFLFSLNDLI